MSKEVRQMFLARLAEARQNIPGIIYSSGPDRREDGARVNSITVIFCFDWPTEKGRPLSSNSLMQSANMAAVGGAIFRVKDFLERQLMEEIDVLDIRPGCVRVRFKLSDEIDIEAVDSALAALDASKDNFDVTSVAGHVLGRAVKI